MELPSIKAGRSIAFSKTQAASMYNLTTTESKSNKTVSRHPSLKTYATQKPFSIDSMTQSMKDASQRLNNSNLNSFHVLSLPSIQYENHRGGVNVLHVRNDLQRRHPASRYAPMGKMRNPFLSSTEGGGSGGGGTTTTGPRPLGVTSNQHSTMLHSVSIGNGSQPTTGGGGGGGGLGQSQQQSRQPPQQQHQQQQQHSYRHSQHPTYAVAVANAPTMTASNPNIQTNNNNNNNSNKAFTKRSHNSTGRLPVGHGGRVAMTPHEVLASSRTKLTAFEQEEILKYPYIWFFGAGAKKIEAVSGGNLNSGYDDENGAYLKITNDHIAYRYESLETVGRGSFGQVVRGIDHQTGREVAIKIIRNKKRFHQQAAVEVKILESLKKIPQSHTVHILDHFTFRNHLCIVFELLGNNLYEVIKRNKFQGFSMSYLKKVVRTLLQSLSVLKQEQIIHCDLKPENILMVSRSNYDIRMIDFGSSCYENQKIYTYIQSRFYRSPEIILGIPYTTAIDMWSLGCVVAELHTGYPLLPGENETEQLACIMELQGMPPEEVLEQSTRRRIFFDSKGAPRNITNNKGKRRQPGTRELSEALGFPDREMLDFVQRCLEWNPSKRLTPADGLRHSWLKEDFSLPSMRITNQSNNNSSCSPKQRENTTTQSYCRRSQRTEDSGIVLKDSSNLNTIPINHDIGATKVSSFQGDDNHVSESIEEIQTEK